MADLARIRIGTDVTVTLHVSVSGKPVTWSDDNIRHIYAFSDVQGQPVAEMTHRAEGEALVCTFAGADQNYTGAYRIIVEFSGMASSVDVPAFELVRTSAEADTDTGEIVLDYDGTMRFYSLGTAVSMLADATKNAEDATNAATDAAGEAEIAANKANAAAAKADATAVESLRYTPQALTAAQQLQARKNIGTLSGVTVDLDRLEGVFDDSYTVMEFLQGSDNTAKNKAVCDYIMAQLPSNPTELQILCSRADYPAFELRMTMTDDDGAKAIVSVFPRLYVSETGFAICLLPLSVYGNYLFETPGVGLIDYVRDQVAAMPGNTVPELFTCYFVKDGTVHPITPSGAARFQMLKPLYLSELVEESGASYSDADKARGREILGCMADDPITSAELETILK